MRLNIRFAIIALFALFISVAPFATSGIGTARAADPVITGILVAQPQPKAPTVLFLQVGTQTLPISISRHTRVTDGDDGAIALTDLLNGDSLRVTGLPNSQGGIDATLIQDMSRSGGPEDFVIKGTLGTVPASTSAPATICVQNAQIVGLAKPFVGTVSPCPPGETPVSVLPTTKLLRSDNTTSSLLELRVNDKITVAGTFVNTQFTADQVRDTSLQIVNTTFIGQVQSVAPNGPTTSVAVIVTKLESTHAPFNQGSQFTLPLANNTSSACVIPSQLQFPCTLVTVGVTSTHGYVPGEIAAGAVIKAKGLFNTQLGQFEFISTVEVQSATPPPTSFDVKGTLASRPFVSNGMLIVCLKDSTISNNQLRPSIGVVSPCPATQLPVALIGATRLTDRAGNAIQMSLLHKGDALQVTGGFVNAVFTAAVVKDLSTRGAFITIQGTVQYVSPFTHPAYFVVRIGTGQQGEDSSTGSRLVVVYVQTTTRIVDGHGVTNHVTLLNPGQHVAVQGVLDASGRNMTTTYVVRVN